MTVCADTVAPHAAVLTRLKQRKRSIASAYARPSDGIALLQLTTTLVPLALLWVLADRGSAASTWGFWLTLGAVVPMSLLLLRVFVLMHDCGHNSLFRTASLNRAVGFLLGVLSGMPQYVWSKHHAYHHATNGDWSKYRGPLDVISTDEYLARSESEQRRYRRTRSIWIAPLAGFVYLIVQPRVTWIRGSLGLIRHILRARRAEPGKSIAEHAAHFESGYWTSLKEYWHMTGNNLAVLAAWVAMSWAVGPILFFGLYLSSIALAGGGALVLFTVQHNFEHAYASETADWDPEDAVLHGTSMLVLPRWLNWFTADIALHHAHHLSASIPNYRLARCHAECGDLFADVTRIRLSQIPAALRCILWDVRGRRIVSVAECIQTR